MRPKSKAISGLRVPTQQECAYIAASWEEGADAGGLIKLRTGLFTLAAVMGLLRALGGENVFDLSAGIASAVVFLLLFSVFLVAWSSRIKKIRKYSLEIANGRFVVTRAVCERAIVKRWPMHFKGFADVQFSDKTVASGLEMPYKHAFEAERTKAVFPVYVVEMNMDGAILVIPCER